MISSAKLTLLACALGLLAACGNERQEARQDLFVRLSENWKQRFTDPAPKPADPAAVLRAALPAILEKVPAPMILMTQRKLGGAEIFVLSTEIGDHRVFGSDYNTTITLEGGVLAETRGLGDDLMSSNNGPLPQLLRVHAEGDYQRVMRTLDGEGHEIAVMFDCRLSADTRERMIESCTTPGKAIRNIYEYAPDSSMLARSEQWLSPRHGHLTIEHIRH